MTNPGSWGVVGKGEADYRPAVVRTIYQMINDDLVAKIAKIDATDMTWVDKQKEFRKLANELKDGSMRTRLEDVVGDATHPFHKALTSDEVAEEYVYYLRANVHSSLGGKVTSDKATSASQWVDSQATKELLEMVSSNGKFVTANGKQMDFLGTAAMAKGKAKIKKVKKKLQDKDFEQLAKDYMDGKISDEDLKIISPLFKESQDEVMEAFFRNFL